MELKVIDNRYLLTNEIGSGGYSKVYLAFDKFRKINVAIKILKCGAEEDDANYLEFQQEVISMVNVSHPNVAEFYGSGIYDGQPYLVMQHIKGTELSKIISLKAYLMVDEVYMYFNQIINGLRAIHNAGIIHRDLKPRNIILTNDGRIVILDFGTALISSSEENYVDSNGNKVVGTPTYMAPEIFLSVSSVSKESDIYALGISMYEMFTGTVPFKAYGKDRNSEIYSQHVHNTIPSVTNINNKVPKEFDEIIAKCCAKHKDDRYHNVDDYKPILKEYIKTIFIQKERKKACLVFLKGRKNSYGRIYC